jgi:hypothetical protein
MSTQVERIAQLEIRVASLEDKVDEMNNKLDELLTLKNKGAGAFWLASLIVGTGVAGFFFQIITWLKG